MSITKYLNLSHLRKLLSALGQRFYAIEQRQDNLQGEVNTLITTMGDADTTYSISMSGNIITLMGSDGNTSTVTLPVYTGGVV